ncbi:hypothetical protein DFJ58DRAFT_748048 [Suillus subalutaceus]|uniref:uncharacterized protein n=1 Tax=Suillus subalutaceus TaxID=48586 RepID=UPI001B875BA0|nr:uncharacterized protein DFJ58DRAFT_748048 [Suillus subalutaceus]KAG1842883.1 hypothetical protein DFJ58DRAFT_748048 [Suillus subalutaceus]
MSLVVLHITRSFPCETRHRRGTFPAQRAAFPHAHLARFIALKRPALPALPIQERPSMSIHLIGNLLVDNKSESYEQVVLLVDDTELESTVNGSKEVEAGGRGKRRRVANTQYKDFWLH